MSVRPDREPGEPRDDGAEDATLADDDWPVAEFYRIEPPAEVVDDERGEIVLQEPASPGPRLRPDISPGLVAALVAVLLLLLLVPAGIWLTNRGVDARGTDAAGTPPRATQPTTTESATTEPAPATVDVPDVVGRALAEARALLEDAGLRTRALRIESDEPAGDVIMQRPEAGTSIEQSSVVVLTVSNGPEQVAVPAVEGMRRSRAVAVLRKVDLRARIENVASDEPRGRVIAQSPAAGADAEDGTLVALQVSSGPATVRIPAVVGLRAPEAVARLRAEGFRVVRRSVDSSRPVGTVVAQSPSAGTEAREGRTITLQVSSGPAQVSVPSVIGLPESAAVAELQAAGLAVDVADEPTGDPSQDGIVVRQTPSAGSTVAEGATVTITVGRSS